MLPKHFEMYVREYDKKFNDITAFMKIPDDYTSMSKEHSAEYYQAIRDMHTDTVVTQLYK